MLYVYFERFKIVLLCFVFGKGETGNISAAVKKYLNGLVDEQERELERRFKELPLDDESHG